MKAEVRLVTKPAADQLISTPDIKAEGFGRTNTPTRDMANTDKHGEHTDKTQRCLAAYRHVRLE